MFKISGQFMTTEPIVILLWFVCFCMYLCLCLVCNCQFGFAMGWATNYFPRMGYDTYSVKQWVRFVLPQHQVIYLWLFFSWVGVFVLSPSLPCIFFGKLNFKYVYVSKVAHSIMSKVQPPMTILIFYTVSHTHVHVAMYNSVLSGVSLQILD